MPYAVPTELKKLRGTDQPCRLIEHEPDPPGPVALDPPEGLTDSQGALWKKLVAESAPGLLRRIDSGVLLQYVIARDLFLQAAQTVAREGYVITQRSRKTVHPAVHVMNSQSIIMRQAEQELGYTPASRTRINTQSDTHGGVSESAAVNHWEQIAMPYQ